MKWYLYLLSLWLIMPVAHAATACDEDIAYQYPEIFALRDGFFLGMGAGLNNYNVKQDVNTIVMVNPSLNIDGFAAGFYLGYGKFLTRLRPVYLGLEFFGYASGAASDYEVITSGGSLNYLSKVAIKNNMGMSVIPGYKINRTSMIYLRGSFLWSKVNVDESIISSGSVFEAEKNMMTKGWGVGIGIETAFYDNFSWRLEYSHANLSHFTTDLGTRVKPSANQFMLDVNYHFDL